MDRTYPETERRQAVARWDAELESLLSAPDWERAVAAWLEQQAQGAADSTAPAAMADAIREVAVASFTPPPEAETAPVRSPAPGPTGTRTPPPPPARKAATTSLGLPLLALALLLFPAGLLYAAPATGGWVLTAALGAILLFALLALLLLPVARRAPHMPLGYELGPENRSDTAVLVVHGIGQHERYETLNSLVSGLDTLPEDGPVSLRFAGKTPPLVSVRPVGAATAGDVTGVQAILELAPVPGHRWRQHRPVDFYEGYWSPRAQRQQRLGTVLNWLAVTAVGLAFNAGERRNESARVRGRAGAAVKALVRAKARFELAWIGIALAICLVAGFFLGNWLLGAVRSVAAEAPALQPFAGLSNPTDLREAAPGFFPPSLGEQADLSALAVLRHRWPVVIILRDGTQRTLYLKQVNLLARLLPWWAWLFVAGGLLSLAMALRAFVRLGQIGRRYRHRADGRRREGPRESWYGWESLRKGRRRQLLLFALWGAAFLLIMQWSARAVAPDQLSVYRSLYAFGILLLALYAVRMAVKEFLVEYLGDVPTYTVTSENSETYEARQQIKAKVSSVLQSLLEEPGYRRVIVVGHSLGSVIVRDVLLALHRLLESAPPEEQPNLEQKLQKVKAFVTMGSPMRKVQNFLEVRRESTPVLVSLRESHDDHYFANPPAVGLHQGPRWLNYWIRSDLVANPFIDRYPVYAEEEIPTRTLPVWTHSDYWYNPDFLEKAARVIWGLPANALPLEEAAAD